MAIIESKIGAGAIGQVDGSTTLSRSGKTGETIIGDAHGRYHEAVSRGNVYSASNQSVATCQGGLGTNSSAFTLFNPANSGKYLSLLEIILSVQLSGSVAYTNIYVLGNLVAGQAAPATVTAIPIRNNLLGLTPLSIAAVYSQATLAAAPVILRPFGTIVFGSAAVTEQIPMLFKDEVAGAIIIPPGIYISIGASNSIPLFTSMTWEEIPII